MIRTDSTNNPTTRPRAERTRKWLAENLSGMIGMTLVLLLVLVAVIAPWIAPEGPNKQSVGNRLQPPALLSAEYDTHILGTDGLGRDVASRIAYGARVSLIVGLAAGLLSCALGVLLGLLAGYFGGILDAIIMRIADIQLAIPSLILALAVIAVLGANTTNIIIILGVTNWVIFARLVRAEVLSLQEQDFVSAITALGAKTSRVLFRHLVPNIAGSVVVVLTLRIGILIIIEATLSYLGLGVQPPTPTWGSMIADGQDLVYRAWWVGTFPGVALALTVLGLNLFGDWLRDRLDPRTSN